MDSYASIKTCLSAFVDLLNQTSAADKTVSLSIHCLTGMRKYQKFEKSGFFPIYLPRVYHHLRLVRFHIKERFRTVVISGFLFRMFSRAMFVIKWYVRKKINCGVFYSIRENPEICFKTSWW